MKLLNLILILASLTPQLVFAQGSAVGGGGTGILQDDTIVLADDQVDVIHPKYDDTSDYEYIQFAPALKEELARMGVLARAYVGLYTADSKDIWFHLHQGSGTTFFDSLNLYPSTAEMIKGKETGATQFFFTAKIPSHCPYLTMSNLILNDPNAKVVPLACTIGKYTYIIKENFKKMSIRDQARLIVHERLRDQAFASAPDADVVIAKVSQGYQVLLSHYNLQLNHQDQPLTDEEVSKIGRFQDAFKSMGGSQEKFPDTFQVWPNGGGMVLAQSSEEIKNIDPTAFIGIGAVIGNGASWTGFGKNGHLVPNAGSFSMGANSKIIGLGMNCFGCKIAKDAEVINSHFSQGVLAIPVAVNLEVGEGSRISDFNLIPLVLNSAEQGGVQSFSDRIMTGFKMTVGAHTELNHLTLRYSNNAFLDMDHFTKANFQIGEGVSLQNASLSVQEERVIEAVTSTVLGFTYLPLAIIKWMPTTTTAHFKIPSGVKFDGTGQACMKYQRVHVFGKNFTLKDLSVLHGPCSASELNEVIQHPYL